MSPQKSAEISSFLKKQRNLQIVLFFCNFADINFLDKIYNSTNEKADN